MTNAMTIFYLLSSIVFFIYSYGFVDFNLTLSSHPLVTGFVSWSQSLAMFNRPLSIQVYLGLIIAMFICYFVSLTHHNSQDRVFPWRFVAVLALIFTVSYPLLSSDVFKYLFSARMVVDYGANPHVLPPNTFPDDTWIRFMRWVHTPSPYGPVMTALAIPPYLLGLKKFVLALFLFKFMTLGAYLLAVWLVGKLAAMINKDVRFVTRAQVYFALNPLIFVEWLTNAHNDGLMITAFLLAVYLLFRNKKVLSVGALLLSIGIKYVTVILLPFIFLKKKISLVFVGYYSLILLFLAPLLYHYSYQYQPWYVTWLIPLAAILGNSTIMWGVGAYTLGSFLRYIPYISTGLWEGTSLQFAIYSFSPPLVLMGAYGAYRLLRRT